MVLPQPQHDRVVDDPAVGRRDQDVLALADRALRQVARRQQLGEAESIPPLDLELSLDRDVPQRDVPQQVPVLRLEVVEVDREEHVVVDGVAARAIGLLGLVEGRLAQARPALDQAHVEGHLLTTNYTWTDELRGSSRLHDASGPVRASLAIVVARFEAPEGPAKA